MIPASPRPAKKRRISSEADDETTVVKSAPALSTTSSAFRKPLVNVTNPLTVVKPSTEAFAGHEGYYLVLWSEYINVDLVLSTNVRCGTGENLPTRNTRHGMATGYSQFEMGTRSSKTSPERRWAKRPSATRYFQAAY